MSDIFLSYKSEDRKRAKIIAELFEQRGYSVWWDRIIPPGKTFDQVIEEALGAAKCVIVLWSRESVKSDWVKNEAREGARRHILIPILIDNVKIPFEFGHIQAAQLIDWQGALPNPEFDLLLKSVGDTLGKPLVTRMEDKKTSINELNQSAQRLYKEGKYTKAIDAWKMVLNLDTENNEAKDGIKIAQREVNNEKITKLNANAHRLFREYKYADAITKWQEVLNFDSNNRIAKEGIEESEGILKKSDVNKKEFNIAKNVEKEVEKEERISKNKIIIIVGTVSIVLLGSWILNSIPDVQTVKTGDNVSIEYISSFTDGKVFDTSIESVAKENNIFTTGREYKPFIFTVGKGKVIKGLDEGVIGMKIGESKTLTISPEKGYGLLDPKAISTFPIIENVPAITTFPKVFSISLDQFEKTFGSGHKVGDNVIVAESNVNLMILNIADNVSLSYNLKVGDQVTTSGSPWSQTVVKIDNNYITTKPDVKTGDTIQFQGVPWNSTVIDINNENITLRHNAIPDTEVPYMFGVMRVHFNKTSIIMDKNHELAGKTLIFKVTLNSIESK